MDKKSITKTKCIAGNYNKHFTQFGPNLAKDFGTSTRSCNEYIKKHDTTQPEKVISVNDFKVAFLSSKIKVQDMMA